MVPILAEEAKDMGETNVPAKELNLTAPAAPAPGFDVRRLWPLAVMAGLFGLAFAMGWHHYLSFTNLYEQRNSLRGFIGDHLVIALLAYIAIYIAATALSIPGGLLLTIAGGFLFGWLEGGIATVIGATTGAFIVFLIVRYSVGNQLAAKAGPLVSKLADGFKKDAFSYLLFLRLVPAFPFFVVNVAPAIFGVPALTYLITTFIGIIPGTLAFTFAGAGLDSVFAAQGVAYEACKASGEAHCQLTINPGSLVTHELFIALVALSVISLLPVLIKRFWKPA